MNGDGDHSISEARDDSWYESAYEAQVANEHQMRA